MNRQRTKGIGRVLLVLALTCSVVSVQAAGVVVSGLNDSDGDPLKLFTGSVTQSGAMDTVITIGLADFMAVDSSATGSSALDTLFMTLTAPAGFFIDSVSFSEGGFNNVSAGVAGATGSIVVDGAAHDLGSHFHGPTGSLDVPWTVGPLVIGVADKDWIDVSIVNSLFAFASSGTATSAKDSAELTIGLSAIPIPAAIWMMGAALVALVTVKRRREIG